MLKGADDQPFDHKRDLTGRWSALPLAAEVERDAAVEVCARALLERYGVMFRRLLTREINAPGWRELTRVYRRLEDDGLAVSRQGRLYTLLGVVPDTGAPSATADTDAVLEIIGSVGFF